MLFLIWLEAKLESLALLPGLVVNICLALLVFLVTRGSSVLWFFFLMLEVAIKYHIWLPHTAMTFFTGHGLCYVAFWSKTHQISEVNCK